MATLGITGMSHGQQFRLASERSTAAATMLDGGLDVTKTLSELLKDVAKVMKDVPFVEGIAGIVFRIMQIRDVRRPFTSSAILWLNIIRK